MTKEYEGMGLSEAELEALAEDEKKGDVKVPDEKVDLPPDDAPIRKEIKEEEGEDDDPPVEVPPVEVPPKEPEKEPAADPYETLEFQEFQPYEAKHVAEFETKVAEFDTQRATLVSQFKEGEITLEDFLVKDRALTAEEGKLRDTEREAATMDKLNEQNAGRAWFANVKLFVGEVRKVEGINYDNATLNAALDSAVKALAGDPANAEKSQLWFLREAHRVVKNDLGIGGKPVVKEEPAAAAPRSREPDLKGVPPNLSKVPAAAPNDPKGDDEFAHLEKLSGMELEEALAALPPSKAERYLRG